SLAVIKPTVIASIASVFAVYFCQVVGWSAGAQLPVGLTAIGLLTFVNWLGVREGTATQTTLTTLKVLGILLLCFAAFALPHHAPGAAASTTSPASPAPAAPVHPLWLAFVAAMIPIFFAYDGWTDSTYVAGEVVDPRRNLPIAILGGTAVVIAVYVLTNLAYFAVLSPAEMAQAAAVGSETVRRILGEWGGRALAVLVAVSTFGTFSASILTGPRVTLAMASDGLFWKPAAHVHERRGSPDIALWLQCVLSWIWLTVAVKGFEDVSGWFVTTSWLFYGLTIAAVLALRRHRPVPARGEATGAAHDVGVGYRTPFYPVTPIVFILVTLGLIASDLAASQWRAAAGIAVAALGFPIYHVWKGRSRT